MLIYMLQEETLKCFPPIFLRNFAALDIVSSSVGSQTNPLKISNTFASANGTSVSNNTTEFSATGIKPYIMYNELRIRKFDVDVGVLELNTCTK